MHAKKRKKEAEPKMSVRFTDIAWLFLAGSVIGFLLEGIWSIFTKGAWENHASVVWGPFCIIYGIGTVGMYLVSRYTASLFLPLRFLMFALTGSGLEYVASLFQEIVFGSTSWNYEGQVLNIGGRVSLKMTLIWGMLGVVFSLFIFPLFERLLEKTHNSALQVTCVCLCGFMLVNLFMSAVAVLRWGERTREKAPSGAFEEYLDRAFHDERMEKTFSNLEFLK